MKNKVLIPVVAIAAVAVVVIASSVTGDTSAVEDLNCPGCNVIFITFDALRADRLGIYGYEKDTTPNLDAFAEKSYVFTDSVTQCATTACSFPSMFTSRFPASDRILDEDLLLKEAQITMPEILKENGYWTVAAVTNEHNLMISQGDFDTFNSGKFETPGETRKRAVSVLNGTFNEITRGPLFFWVHFYQPHYPYNPPKEIFDEFYPNPGNEPTYYSEEFENHTVLERHLALLDYYSQFETVEMMTEFDAWDVPKLLRPQHFNFTPTLSKQYVARYDGAVKEVDREFGLFMDFLESEGLLKNSMVIVSADHGESLGEHKIFGHNHLHYNEIHVPLIVYLPGNKHEVIGYPVMNVDIFPTVFQLLGISIDHPIRGQNLFGGGREFQFSEYTDFKTAKKGNFQLIAAPRGSGQLYNLENDPDELANILGNHPQLVEELRKIVADASQPIVDTEDYDDVDILEKLKSIGYIN